VTRLTRNLIPTRIAARLRSPPFADDTEGFLKTFNNYENDNFSIYANST